MSFEPEKITEKNIRDAVDKIEFEKIALKPSVKFSVIINNKPYPPKEVMKYAHELMNGERIWRLNGGKPTNNYLINLGFPIKDKFGSDIDELPITGNVWKLGCKWEAGNPSFYNFIKENEIVIGVNDKNYSVGDLILITEGYSTKSIGLVLDYPKPVIENNLFEIEFNKLKIPFKDWVNFSNVEWYELDEDEQFWYPLQAGIRQVRDLKVKNKVIEIWNNRNANYWIFQGNPNDFDFEKALKNNLLENWTVSAHKEKIKVNDKVILWMSGKKSGCFALAEITQEPQIEMNAKDSLFWKKEDKNPLKAGIRITNNLIDAPLLWNEIKTKEGLENLKVGNQGTNFTATKKEYNLIKSMIMSNSIENSTFKNIILYGPPGTGKTYNSIDKAVEIINGKSLTHSENKIIFDKLKEDGQIDFVTFHQNYSYEDFMVGLKPDVDNDLLRFKSHKGIFYEISKRAKENYLASKFGKGLAKSFDEALSEILDPLVENDTHIEIKMASGITYKIVLP
jgi:hypothetical protein